MKSRMSIKTLVLGVVAGATIAFAIAAATGSPKGTFTGGATKNESWNGQKWEYVVVAGLVNGFGDTMGTTLENLDAAGQQGWEAVAVYGNGATLMKRPAQ